MVAVTKVIFRNVRLQNFGDAEPPVATVFGILTACCEVKSGRTALFANLYNEKSLKPHLTQ